MVEFVDTHCHIHFSDYPVDIDEALNQAKSSGVTKMICVGCSLADSQKAVDFANAHHNVWASVGAHPHDGASYIKDKEADNKLATMLTQPKAVACGEIGLDYFHQHASKDDQEKVLRRQIETALPYGLPFIFHVRDAFDDFWKIFDDYKIKDGVVHSFSATGKELDQILSRRLYVGLNGIMTFTKNQKQLEAAKKLPLDKMLLETDAPFLTPAPDRGKTCEPKHVRNVAEFLAELRNEPLEKIAEQTTNNALRLFRIN